MANTVIKQSHERCISLNTNSRLVTGNNNIINEQDIKLVNITWDCIRNIKSSFFTLYNTFFTLSNKDLIVLNHFVNKNSNIDMNKYIPPVGTSLKEEDYGTTATSIALLKGDVAYVVKNEHFNKKSRDLTCVAAPIRLDNKILGYLSLSTIDVKQVNVLRVFIESLALNLVYELKKDRLKSLLTQKIDSDRISLYISSLMNVLSENEKAVLGYMFENYTNDMIAERMFISETAVRKYIYSIYKKNGTNNKYDILIDLIYKHICSLI